MENPSLDTANQNTIFSDILVIFPEGEQGHVFYQVDPGSDSIHKSLPKRKWGL